MTLGLRSGIAHIVVSVPSLGYVDTAKFTVKPGAATGMQGSPADTAVYANGTVALRSVTVDRYGNPRPDAVAYTVLSGPATLSGSTLTMNALGRVAVRGTVGPFADTTFASGVPQGLIAAAIDNGGGIVRFNLDGSNYRTIANVPALNVAWSPSDSTFVYDQEGYFGYPTVAPIKSVAVGGRQSTLDSTPGARDGWPAFSRDGKWIYFGKVFGGSALWRVHPDGTGNGAVPSQQNGGVELPSVSPDNTQIAYIVPGFNYLEVFALSTGASTYLGVSGQNVAWAPTGTTIAYVTMTNGLALINSTGGGNRVVTSGPYGGNVAWSPDGQYLIARNSTTFKLDVIDVTTGTAIPVGFTGHLGSVTWH